jgi:hypothetical protein
MQSVEILLDRPRRLRFTMNALSDFEEHARTGIGKMLTEQSLAGLRLALWCGLKWEDRTITPEKAGDILQRYIDQFEGMESPLVYVYERVNQALQASGILGKAPQDGTAAEPTTPTDAASSAPASATP